MIPQVVHHRDLIEPIKNSDIKDAELLSMEKLTVIRRVAGIFLSEQDTYYASHREKVWQNASTGSLLSYSYAHELTAIRE